MKQLLTGITLMVALTCQAADPMYNEIADAKAEIKRALAQAATTGVPGARHLRRQLVRGLQDS
jgi:hypothetical protein